MATLLRIGTLIGVFASCMATSPSRAWALEVAVVHVQKAMQSLAHYKQAKDFLESEKSKREQALKSAQQALEDKRSELQAKEAISAPGALAEEQQAWLAEAQQLSNQLTASQQQLSQLEASVTQQLMERLQYVVGEVAREKDLDFVFDRGAELDPNVLYHQTPLDVTEAVVAKYRARFKDKPLKFQ